MHLFVDSDQITPESALQLIEQIEPSKPFIVTDITRNPQTFLQLFLKTFFNNFSFLKYNNHN